MCKYLLEKAETLFEPKQVDSNKDWLVSKSEKGQDITTYQKSPKIKWHNPRSEGTIYLFIIDDTINDDLAQ